jgi:hypothetical protein
VTAWLLRMIGISSEIATQIDKVEWRWARPEWFWFGLILLLPASWYIARRHRSNLPHVPRRPRRLLTACRIGVLAVLVVVLGGPYLRLDETIEQKPVVALIIDESSSMSLPAGPFDPATVRSLAQAAGLIAVDKPGAKGGELTAELRKQLNIMTRQQLLEAVLKNQRATTLAELQKSTDLRIYRVARRIRQVELDQKTEPLAEAEGAETSLGMALQRAMDDAAGRKIGGIVLMSDGRSTAGVDPVTIVRRTAETAAPASEKAAPAAPIFSIPVGGDQPPPDIAILDALAPAQVTKGDSVAVVATLSSTGFDNKEIKVVLKEGTKTLDTQTVVLNGSRRQQVQLNFTPDEAGAKLLSIETAPQPEETVADNNRQPLSIQVGTDRFGVLYLEGIPRWDFRFLDHALRRDRGVEVKFVMESQLMADGAKAEDLPRLAGLPKTQSDWAEYHVVILGDVSPALLPPQMQEALAKAVEEDGVGLVIQCGTQFMPQAFLDGPLGRLLPVKFDGEKRGGDEAKAAGGGGIDAPSFAPFKMTVTPTGSMHPAFSLFGNTTKDRQVWSGMPPFFWAAAATDIKPGASLLAEFELPGTGESGGKRPLIAEQFVGRGRVFLLGADETFRWRRNIGDQLFYRFWGQVVRHVARRQTRGGSESWIDVQPQHVEPGSAVAVELYAVNGAGKPLEDAQVFVDIADEKTGEKLKLDKGTAAGYYRGVWPAQKPGLFTVSYVDSKSKSVSATVRVADSGRERSQPTVDRETLGTLADVSRGALMELDHFAELPAKVAGETTTIHKPLEQEVWDNWLTLVILVVLYCTDVGIRRVLGLT